MSRDIVFTKDKISNLSLYKQCGVLEDKIIKKLPSELQSDFDSLIKLYEQIIEKTADSTHYGSE